MCGGRGIYDSLFRSLGKDEEEEATENGTVRAARVTFFNDEDHEREKP